MSSALVEPRRKTWIRAEVDTLIAAGHFEGQRFELIEGEIFDKMGQSPAHSACLSGLFHALGMIFGFDKMRMQLPVEPADSDANENLPEPDVSVTVESAVTYRNRHPGADDISLVAEVSDATYLFDTKLKAKLYARARIRMYLVLDINDQELLVYQSPRDGIYTEIRVLRAGYTLPLGSGVLSVSDLFPE